MFRTRTTIVSLTLLLAMLLAVPAMAAPLASRSGPAPTDAAGLARELHGNEELARALAAHGLSPEQVEQRLAQLSAEDLEYLGANLDQVQSAGEVPDYIWILLAVLLGIVILGAIF